MPSLNDFRALLFDVDLTLTNSKREVSGQLVERLKELAQRNLQIGVCTGRTYVALKETIFPYFPSEALHITAGGSQVVNGQGQIIWQSLLSEKTCHELNTLGQEHHQMYYIPTMESGYGTQTFLDKYQGLHNLIPPLKLLDELTEWTPPCMVFVNVSPEFLDILQQRTDITLKVSTSSLNFVSVDVTAKGVTKATGITEWGKAVGIEPSQVIGVGDSDNDVEFLDMVGYAVGMGNSTPQIKALADRVIGSTDEEGLAVYLDALLKGQLV
jgi:Cof subfamily protein (haloacid dehalogenase superfamily)